MEGMVHLFRFLTEGKKKINVKIPKDSEPKALSRDECIELMNNQLKAKKK